MRSCLNVCHPVVLKHQGIWSSVHQAVPSPCMPLHVGKLMAMPVAKGPLRSVSFFVSTAVTWFHWAEYSADARRAAPFQTLVMLFEACCVRSGILFFWFLRCLMLIRLVLKVFVRFLAGPGCSWMETCVCLVSGSAFGACSCGVVHQRRHFHTMHSTLWYGC